MVVDATDQLLTRELNDYADVRERAVRQLRTMESDIVRSAAEKLGIDSI
jgi:hypothetical protein